MARRPMLVYFSDDNGETDANDNGASAPNAAPPARYPWADDSVSVADPPGGAGPSPSLWDFTLGTSAPPPQRQQDAEPSDISSSDRESNRPPSSISPTVSAGSSAATPVVDDWTRAFEPGRSTSPIPPSGGRTQPATAQSAASPNNDRTVKCALVPVATRAALRPVAAGRRVSPG